MNKILTSILLGVLFIGISFSGTGCTGGDTGGEETSVKSMSSYYDEADKAITASNAEAELEKMMKEIDSDTE